MGNLIKILDIVASIGTVVSLFLVVKNYRWWVLYTFSSVCFIIVCLANKIPGLTAMGICLFVVGIRNFICGRRNVKS
jgi:hypothetical protein